MPTTTTHTEHAGSIELLNGTFIRFGPDEQSEFDVPISVSFDTEMPGGFGPANITLPRPRDFDFLRLKLFASVTLYDARSAQTLYEGRITGVPMDTETLTLECEGWVKALEDDQTARFLGVDRDFSKWQGASVQYQLDNIAANYATNDPSVVPDPLTGSASLLTEIEADWGVTALPDAPAFFDAQGLDIGLLDYAWKVKGVGGAPVSDSTWNWFTFLARDDTFFSITDSTADLQAAGPGSGTLTGGPGRKFAGAEFFWSGSTGSTPPEGVSFTGVFIGVYWTLLAPIGTHGLPLIGTLAAPATGRGLRVSDMVGHLVGSFAPVLTYTSGTNGSITPTSFAVPHASWLDETTAKAMIDELVVFGGNDLYPLDYFVYDDRTFYLQPATQHGTTWHVRRDSATTEGSEGPDSARLLNGVRVTYDDGTGTRRSVGPPGSDSGLESNSLADDDPDLSVNQDGQRHWLTFDAGITSQNGALLIGEMILNFRNIEAWRGNITATGDVQNDAGIWYPCALVRAGDWIVVDDDPDTRPRKVVSTSYTEQTLQASVGAQPDHLDSLLARAGIVLQGHI